MLHRRIGWIAGSGFTLMIGLVLGPGCAQNVVPAIPTGDTSTSGDALNPLASTEVASGFAQFANDAVAGASTADPANATSTPAAGVPGLSQDVLNQIEELQNKLDSGDLTAEEFAKQVDALIGDIAPQHAFAGRGFFGRPFGGPMRGPLADKLNLTDAQKTKAKKIFTDLHHDIRIATIEALANMRLELTDAQRKQLDDLRDTGFAALRNQTGAGTTAATAAGTPARGIRARLQSFFERLADALKLTNKQRTAITQIRDDLRTSVRTLHQDARDAFRALLTAEQLTILDQIEQGRPNHPDATGDGSTGGDNGK